MILFDFNPLASNIPLSDVLNSLWIVVVASIFAVRRETTVEKEKQLSLKMQAASIAHEMRTPLSAIEIISDGLQKNMPILVRTQKKAQEIDKSIQNINPLNLNAMIEAP